MKKNCWVPKQNTPSAALLCSHLVLTVIDQQYIRYWVRKFSWYWIILKWKVNEKVFFFCCCCFCFQSRMNEIPDVKLVGPLSGSKCHTHCCTGMNRWGFESQDSKWSRSSLMSSHSTYRMIGESDTQHGFIKGGSRLTNLISF